MDAPTLAPPPLLPFLVVATAVLVAASAEVAAVADLLCLVDALVLPTPEVLVATTETIAIVGMTVEVTVTALALHLPLVETVAVPLLPNPAERLLR